MANYLLSHYKGTYRLKTPYDETTNQFPRDLNGTFSDYDIYIDCQNNIKILSEGHGILKCYIPSLMRGHNILKKIKTELGDNIIIRECETDSEVLFYFHAKNMDKLESILKPRTSGANISPFSSKNLPKSNYLIPDEDLVKYKNIIKNIPENQRIALAHMSKNYLKSLATKKNPWEKIKADMALKCMKPNQYIHSINKWNEYLKYLEKELETIKEKEE